MIVNVGSENQVKIEAVKEVLENYEIFNGVEFVSKSVYSSVSKQPKSLDETILGAMNRARNAFENCDYSFGIESGLIEIQHTKTGFMNICACSIYDGRKFYRGLSSAFEYPPEVIKLIFEEGLEVNEAFYKVGLTENPKLGSAEGAIGILTKGKLMRKEYTKQAIITALISLENKGYC